MGLTITHCATEVPASLVSSPDWAELEAAAWRSNSSTPQKGLLEIMFKTFESEPIHTSYDSISADISSPVSEGLSQADLASRALDSLYEDLGETKPDLAIYSATSIDEDFYSSVMGRLGGDYRFSKAPHFGVGQLQGASLAAALDIADSMLTEDHSQSALFFAAEKWGVPSTRNFSKSSMLSDGASALWITRNQEVNGLEIIDVVNRSCMPFTDGSREINFQELYIAFNNAINSLLERNKKLIADNEISLLATGQGRFLDSQLEKELNLESAPFCSSADLDFSSAAASISISQALQAQNQDVLENGQYLISCGASYGGAIGVVLLRINKQQRDNA